LVCEKLEKIPKPHYTLFCQQLQALGLLKTFGEPGKGTFKKI